MTEPFTYWAFISYSRQDQAWAKSLHRRLEGYRLPLHVRPPPETGVPTTDRVWPVFLDQDELTVSPDLGARLRETLDRSRWLVILASRASAGSRYVDAEARRFLETGRADDVRVIVLDDAEGGGVPLPPALREESERTGREPLWLDARGPAKPDRRVVLRLVAGLLGVSFDALWQRDQRRRRRRLLSTLAAGALLAAAVTGLMLRQRRIGDRYKPERQTAAFLERISAEVLQDAREMEPGFREDELDIEILGADDLNGDGLLDFFVMNRTRGFFGSGGASTDAYLAEDLDRHRIVLDLFGSPAPRTRASKAGGFKEILVAEYFIDGEPVYTVNRWTGRDYAPSHYAYGNGVLLDYWESDPIVIGFVDPDDAESLAILPEARFRSSPKASAPEVRSLGEGGVLPESCTVVGALPDKTWYLVELWKGKSAFVSRDHVERR